MKLNEAIINIRVDLQNSGIKKSGKNKYGGFGYYELSDFLPKLNELMLGKKMNDIFTIDDGVAILKLNLGEDTQEYKIPFIMFSVPLNKNGQQSMQDIQYLGALNTYYKRYLYLNAFGITDGDVIDAIDNNSHGEKAVNNTAQIVTMVSDAQVKLIYTLITKKKLDESMLKTHYNIESMKELNADTASKLIDWLNAQEVQNG